MTSTIAERLRMRQAERELTARHHEAQERLRISVMRLREIAIISNSGAVPPDSNYGQAQANRDYREAAEQSKVAFARLVSFILHGTIPSDLNI